MYLKDFIDGFVTCSVERNGARLLFGRRAFVRAIASLFCFAGLMSCGLGDASGVGAAERQMGINTFVLDTSCSSPGLPIDWATLAHKQVTAISELGGNSIGIEFPVYMSSATGSRVFAGCAGSPFPQDSPTPAELGIVVDIAHAANLNVFLRPLLAQHNLAPKWRGNIEPRHKGRWFRSYTQTLLPYAEMANQHHVEHFAVGTELSSLNGNPHWMRVVGNLQHAYPDGDLVMAYLSSAPGPVVPHTSYGADPYVSLRNSSTRVSNHSNWRQLQRALLQLMPQGPLPLGEIVWDEVGISASRGALWAPWRYDFPSSKFDADIQAKWFKMACNIFRKKHLAGVYFQGTVLSEDAGAFPPSDEPGNSAYIQPESQVVIRRCFAGESMEK
jgi:hypothetical protein